MHCLEIDQIKSAKNILYKEYFQATAKKETDFMDLKNNQTCFPATNVIP